MRSTRSSALRWPVCRRNTLTIWSRLLDRFPPAGRTSSTSDARILMRVSVVVPGPATLFGGEGGPAAARGGGVWILDGESAAGHRVDEVDLAAVLFDHQPILKARAPSALHEHAQSAVLLLLFSQKLTDFRGCRWRHV